MERNENGTLKKGNVLNPNGRPKGSGNKLNAELREFLALIIDENKEQLQTDLQELEPKERIKIMLEMMKFVIPTLKSVDGNIAMEQNPITAIQFKVIRPKEDKN